MARNNQLILAGALLLVLLFTYGVTFTEERPLKADDHKVVEAAGHHHGANVVGSSRKANMNRDVLEDNDANPSASAHNNVTAYDTDDFRPTTPGHSPGAGHSTGPASNDNN